MLKIAIVEDETAASQHLSQCLRRYRDESESEIEMEVCVYEDAASFLKTYQSDYSIVFMDISMPGMDGMAASRRLREMDQNAILIFVTSMAQYAIEGYEVNAFDFIVKPINYYSFKLKMKKAVAAWNAQAQTPARIMVVNEAGNWYINAPDIYYVEVMSHRRIFHTVHGDVESSGSLKDVEKQVSGEDFFRCNYCYLVNLGHVTSVQGDRVTVGGQSLAISRNRKKEFMQRLVRYYGQKNK